MFSKLFKKSNKEVSKMEVLSTNELSHVIGGGDPIPGVDVSIEIVRGTIRFGDGLNGASLPKGK